MPNPECPTCPVENNPALVQLARRVEQVYVSDTLATAGSFHAEEAIREGTITPDDIDRLTASLNNMQTHHKNQPSVQISLQIPSIN